MNTDNKHKFIQLTEPFWHRLYNIALGYSQDRDVAEDWCQETLLRAWKNFTALQEHVAVYAWLLKILDRVVADDKRRSIRRNQIAPVILVDDVKLLSHPCSAAEPFKQLVSQQNHQQIMLAIQQLPDEFRQVVLLRDIDGLSYCEIADILELAKGTIMSRLSRGRRLLSSIIIKEQEKLTQAVSQHNSRITKNDYNSYRGN